MPEQERCARVQKELLEIAIGLERTGQRLHELRESLPLPPDVAQIYDREEPWPLALELDAEIGAVQADCIDVAAEKLRRAARATPESVREAHRSLERDHRRAQESLVLRQIEILEGKRSATSPGGPPSKPGEGKQKAGF
jgi:hypothetical protein